MTRVALGLALSLLAACGGTTSVGARVVHPARIPVESLELLTIVHTTDSLSVTVAEGLAHALAQQGVRVTTLAEGDGARPGDGALLELTLGLDVSARTEWISRPENICGLYGCYVRYVNQPVYVRRLIARYEARLVDAATRRTIEAVRGVVEAAGEHDTRTHGRISTMLVESITPAFRPRVEHLRLSFETVDDETVDEAIEAVRDGGFAEARALIEARLARDRRLDDRTRARLHYDLALLLAYGPIVSDREATLARALEHAERSVTLDPTGRHRRVHDRIRLLAYEARSDALRARATAAAETPALGIPEVPEAYRVPAQTP